MTAAIDVRRLDYEYPGKRVLHDVTFQVPEGSITALVGPNGAGKTTLMRCIAGLERLHAGSVSIKGTDVASDPRAVHRACGYLSDFFGLYDALTVRQCLTYAAWCHKVEDPGKRIAEVCAQAGLETAMNKHAGTLSRGWRQRLGIGLALVHNPPVLILDEPASGMDPEARIALSRLMRSLRAGGKTIIVSSHILNELEDYCTDMLVIREGRVSEHVALAAHARAAARTLKIGLSAPDAKYLEILSAQPHVSRARLEDGALLCDYAGSDAEQQKLLQTLLAAGAPVVNFAAEAHKLQDAYLAVTKGEGAKA
jgi:ABC-2 type transport system ATP-binding protein